MTGKRSDRRPAFTLLEIMVVLVIIALLVAILLPTLSGALRYVNQVRTRTEIGQLEAAIQSFESKFNVNYIPSQIKLCKWSNDYNLTNQLDKDSLTYLLKLFPKLMAGSNQTFPYTQPYGMWATDSTGQPYLTAASPGSGVTGVTGVNWIQDSTFTGNITWPPQTSPPTTPPGPSVTLEGHQCLVFFLGGIQTTSPLGCTGFSTNSKNPGDTSSTVDRIPPFFEFAPSRLTQFNLTNSSTNANVFLSYLDPVGNPPQGSARQPYAYFSSYKKSGSYDPYGGSGDNPSLISPASGSALLPYFISGSSPNQFLKPDRFQIISAGADGQFGAGGPFATGGGNPASGTVGADDLSNFASGQLKGGQ